MAAKEKKLPSNTPKTKQASENAQRAKFKKGMVPWNKGIKYNQKRSGRPVGASGEFVELVKPPPGFEKCKTIQQKIDLYRNHYGPLAFQRLASLGLSGKIPFREESAILTFLAQQWAGKAPGEVAPALVVNFKIGVAGGASDRHNGDEPIDVGQVKIGRA